MAIYASGTRAWGICQRCGLRDRLVHLIFDEQYPNLRVHPECWDEKHPQERLLPVIDPVSLWKPSPEDYPIVPPVLEAELDSPTGPVQLTWTEATSPVLNINGYRVYRSINGEPDVLLDTLLVERDDFGTITVNPLAYEDDEEFDPGDVLLYYVVAFSGFTELQQDVYSAASNVVEVGISGETLSAPVLDASQASPGADIDLAWTASVPSNPFDPVLGYRIYVRVNAGAFSLLDETLLLAYVDDTGYSEGDLVEYYIQAYNMNLTADSNVDGVTYQAAPFNWNLEAADIGGGDVGAFRDYTFLSNSYKGIFTGDAAAMLGQAGPIRLNQITTGNVYFYLEVGRDSADAADAPFPFAGLRLEDEGGVLLELLTANSQSGEGGTTTSVDSDRFDMGGGTDTAYINYRWELPVGSNFVFEVGKRYILTLIPMGDPTITAEQSGPNTGYFRGVEGSIVNSIVQGTSQLMTVVAAQDYTAATGFRLYLEGYNSQPLLTDFTSVTINGITYLRSAATFSGGGGNIRTWLWAGSPAGLVDGVVYPITLVI